MIAHLIKPVLLSRMARRQIRKVPGGALLLRVRNYSEVPTDKPVGKWNGFEIHPIPLDELEKLIGLPHDANLDKATRWSRYRTKLVDEIHHHVLESKAEGKTHRQRGLVNAVGQPDGIWREVDRLRASVPESKVGKPWPFFSKSVDGN